MQNTINKPDSNVSIAWIAAFAPKASKAKAAEMLNRLGYRFSIEEGFWTLHQGDPRTWAQVLRKCLGKEEVTLVR